MEFLADILKNGFSSLSLLKTGLAADFWSFGNGVVDGT